MTERGPVKPERKHTEDSTLREIASHQVSPRPQVWQLGLYRFIHRLSEGATGGTAQHKGKKSIAQRGSRKFINAGLPVLSYVRIIGPTWPQRNDWESVTQIPALERCLDRYSSVHPPRSWPIAAPASCSLLIFRFQGP